jgi:hypothetical protein
MYQIECELCNRIWCSNSIDTILQDFYQHLQQHSKEEVEVLRKLAELDLKNHSAYEELKEMLSEYDYQAWEKIRTKCGISEGDSH